MKRLTIIAIAAALSGCANLTPEQNHLLISAGIGLGKAVVAHRLAADDAK